MDTKHSNPGLHGHVILTYGPRPSTRITRHRPAHPQNKNIVDFGAAIDEKVLRITYDLARSVDGLSSLPELSRWLKHCKEKDNGVVIMDDLNRLLRACRPSNREQLLSDLDAFGDRLFFVRQQARLCEIDEPVLQLMRVRPDTRGWSFKPRKSRKSEDGKRWQTFNAVEASRQARGAAAVHKAQELAAIRENLANSDAAITHAAIAREANDRGLTTTRGNPWNSGSVSRALKRLAEDSDPEKDVEEEHPKTDTSPGARGLSSGDEPCFSYVQSSGRVTRA